MTNLSLNFLFRTVVTLFVHWVSLKYSIEGAGTTSGSNLTSFPVMQRSLEFSNISIDPTCKSGRTCVHVCSVGGRCLCLTLVSLHTAVSFSSYWNNATWRLGMPRTQNSPWGSHCGSFFPWDSAKCWTSCFDIVLMCGAFRTSLYGSLPQTNTYNSFYQFLQVKNTLSSWGDLTRYFY